MSTEYDIDQCLENLNRHLGRIKSIKDEIKEMDAEKKDKIKTIYLKDLGERFSSISFNINDKDQLESLNEELGKFIYDLERVILSPDIEDFIQDFKSWIKDNFNLLPDEIVISWIKDSLEKAQSHEIESLKDLLETTAETSVLLKDISNQLKSPLKRDLEDLKMRERKAEYLKSWLEEINGNLQTIKSDIETLQSFKKDIERYKDISQKSFTEKCSSILDNFYKSEIEAENRLRDAKRYWDSVKKEIDECKDSFILDLESFKAIYNDLHSDTKSLILDYIRIELVKVNTLGELLKTLRSDKEKAGKIHNFEDSINDAKEKYAISSEMPKHIVNNKNIKNIKRLLSEILTLIPKSYESLDEYEKILEQDNERVKEIQETSVRLKNEWTREIEIAYNRYRKLSSSSEISELLEGLSSELNGIKESKELNASIESYQRAKGIIKNIEDKIDLSDDAKNVLDVIERIAEENKTNLVILSDNFTEKSKLVSGLLELTEKGIVGTAIYR
jgi:dihydroneopterin aldolase